MSVMVLFCRSNALDICFVCTASSSVRIPSKIPVTRRATAL